MKTTPFGTPLVLASASPRRRELLESAGVRVEVRPSGVDETLPPGMALEEALAAVALRKAHFVAKAEAPGTFVLAADTVVEIQGRVLGKPRDEEEAKAMLALLSGKAHRVLTGVALLHDGHAHTLWAQTRVTFRTLPAQWIAWYVATGEPLDKAGAYAIQGRAAGFVETVEGSYTNVVGLPLAQTLTLLEREGFPPPGA